MAIDLRAGSTVHFIDCLQMDKMYGNRLCTRSMIQQAGRTAEVSGSSGVTFMIVGSGELFDISMLRDAPSITDFPEDEKYKVEVKF
jgi:hypothetical protein